MSLITAKEARAILSVHQNTLINWRRAGYGPQPKDKFGTVFVYDRQEVEAFAERREAALPKRYGCHARAA